MKPNVNPAINDDIGHVQSLSWLDDDIQSVFAGRTRTQVYRNGQMLFFDGDECKTLSIVLSGRVHLYFISAEGHETIFAELGAGDALGDVELTLDCIHSANAVACGATSVLVIQRSTFNELSHMPQVSALMLKTFARRLRKTLTFAEGLALHPLQTRLARLLVELGETHGLETPEGLIINRVISQEQMGRLINGSRPRVNAQLQAWKSEGVIAIRNSRIIIRDRLSLESLSRHSDP